MTQVQGRNLLSRLLRGGVVLGLSKQGLEGTELCLKPRTHRSCDVLCYVRFHLEKVLLKILFLRLSVWLGEVDRFGGSILGGFTCRPFAGFSVGLWHFCGFPLGGLRLGASCVPPLLLAKVLPPGNGPGNVHFLARGAEARPCVESILAELRVVEPARIRRISTAILSLGSVSLVTEAPRWVVVRTIFSGDPMRAATRE